MDSEEARRCFGAARIARLATVGGDGRPHIVPFVFVLTGDTVYSAVDAKPKRTTALQRLANVAAHPAVAVLVDHYDDDDWTRLWWVRGDGRGRILDARSREGDEALVRLAARYPQHRRQPPPGPVLAIDVTRWTGWSAAAPG